MTDFSIFNNVYNTLYVYFFGSDVMIAVAIIVFLGIILLFNNIKFNYIILLLLPLISGLVVGGWLGFNYWILNLTLILVAITYGYMLIKYLS